MSKNFLKVKKFYDEKLWSIARVRNAVKARWITEYEFKQITGEDYKTEE